MKKSPCCNKEMRGYTSKEYPNDSGYKCPCCGAEFSYLQIARGALDKKCEPWGLCKSKNKHGWIK
jgi:hypothetical protein